MLLFRDPEDMPPPDSAQLAALTAWIERLQAEGRFVAGGSLAEAPASVLRGSRGKKITDGPFVEAKEVVAGYLLVTAGGHQQAAALARACPILAAGTSIEVRQLSPIDGRIHDL
jgi:hypothetical protein